MRSQPEQVLDACITKLNEGQDLEAVLEQIPELADELRPLLAAAALVRVEVPLPQHKIEHKEQLLAAVAARRRLVETANGIVVEVKAGVPLRELLARTGPDLRPLIVAAWRMYSTPAPVPSAEALAHGKATLMRMAAERQAKLSRERRGRSGIRLTPGTARGIAGVRRGLLPTPSWARRAWSGAVAALITVALVGVTAAGVGGAAASSLPGDSLYGVKELGRNAQVLFAFDPARRAELNLRFAEDRMAEMVALASTGRGVPLDLVESWLENQSRALMYIEQLPLGQRELLADMLLATVDRGRELGGRLCREIDAGALERLVSGSDELAGRAQESVAEAAAPIPRTTAAAARELPAEKSMGRHGGSGSDQRNERRAEESASAEIAAPAADSAPLAIEAPPAPQVVQPGAQDEGGADSAREEPRSDPSRPPATEPSEKPATSTSPPPELKQPIFEEPTDTPEPVGTGPAGIEEPPDLPVEPISSDP